MILGIDTSNYTTSVALVDQNKILNEERKLLEVKHGARGLRQSEAFYQHVNQLPLLLKKIEKNNFDAVCVSTRPRRLEESYMPCFKAGTAIADVISNLLQIPKYEVSHQEGHIQAALYGNPKIDNKHFLCVQLSGGTTEILSSKEDSVGFESNIIGKTIDISAGQLLDRIGVACGIPFPCGAYIDQHYVKQHEISQKPSIKDSDISFAGPETKFHQYLQDGVPSEIVFSAVLDHIAEAIGKLVFLLARLYQCSDILFCGGVSSSKHLREAWYVMAPPNVKIYFAQLGLSSDNAAGVALLGERLHKG